ncbi:AGAP004163-PB-like protein [Anopheles sinensis]|uniref:glutathione transferase n=1 Tax=Anopheles sinensis TaxID=74873 RepID=A0A084WTJ9_ANOSI|nr:AGAP004163-PB-like protein [Anopheles sinensis]
MSTSLASLADVRIWGRISARSTHRERLLDFPTTATARQRFYFRATHVFSLSGQRRYDRGKVTPAKINDTIREEMFFRCTCSAGRLIASSCSCPSVRRVILSYLVSAYGKDENLYPKDFRSRAIVDQRLHFDLGTLYQRVVDYYFPTIQLGAHLDQTKKAKLAEALGWFEAMLKQFHWSAANHFTIADVALCVTVSQIEAFQFDLLPYPKVRAWLQKCKDELEPHGYKEINEAGAETLAGLFRSKLKQ